MARFLLASALTLFVAGPAFAQPKKKDPTPPATGDTKPADGDGGTAVDMPEDDTPSADPSGVNENPDAPKGPVVDVDKTATVNPETPAPKPERKGYPIEETLRPITLPALMSEAGIDVRNYIKPYDGNTTLRGRFGITKKIQIGLEYTIGGFFDDVGGEDKVKFNTGKSIGLDLTYSVFDWLGVRMGLPFYLDPFAMGVTLGAPLKFRIGDRFAFGGMGDFLTIRITKFVPSTTDERMNDLNSYNVDSGTATSKGSLNFTGFATWQWKPNVAIGGEFGLLYDDFNDINTPFSLRARAQYSTSNKLDFGALFGFGDVANWKDTVLLNLYAQLRI
jgi:hypothetical protein